MTAVYKKELKSYLTSMIGYIFIAFILVIVGIYFSAINIGSAWPRIGDTLSNVTFVFFNCSTGAYNACDSGRKKTKDGSIIADSACRGQSDRMW